MEIEIVDVLEVVLYVVEFIDHLTFNVKVVDFHF